jgi:hypothetical protein
MLFAQQNAICCFGESTAPRSRKYQKTTDMNPDGRAQHPAPLQEKSRRNYFF